MDISTYVLPAEGNDCSTSVDCNPYELPDCRVAHFDLYKFFAAIAERVIPLEPNSFEHCSIKYCSSYRKNINFLDLNEHAFQLVRGLVKSFVFLHGDSCTLGRCIFMVNIGQSNLIQQAYGDIRLPYPIPSFLRHDVLILNPKMVLASSRLDGTMSLRVFYTFNCCRLECIYLTGFWLPDFNKSFLRSGLKILAGLPQQDLAKSIATTQIILSSKETSLEDHQEVEESKKDYMTQGQALDYPSLEKALPARGNFIANCSCSGLLDKLPENLLVDIFCRLEDKTLVRLKCICKSWNKLISDVCAPKISALAPLHGFIYTAKRIDSEEFIEFVPNRFPAPVTISQDFVESLFGLLPFQPSPDDLLDCCNGLFLFKSDAFEEYYVCNPMTRQCVSVPRNIRRQKPTYAALAFNPNESTHYKVCCFEHSGRGRNRTLSLEIFSSEAGDWTYYEIPRTLYKQGDIWVKRCVYLDNVLYRLSFSKVLLCFDLKEVKAHAIDIPEKDRCDHWGFVGTSKGHLYYSNRYGSQFYVWMLEDRLNSNPWILMHNISIDNLDIFFSKGYLSKYKKHHLFKPYAMHPSSNVIFIGTPDLIAGFYLQDMWLLPACRRQSGKIITSGPFSVFLYTCCLVNLIDFNRKGEIYPGLQCKGAGKFEDKIMRHLPLLEVANSSETSKKDKLIAGRFATDKGSDDELTRRSNYGQNSYNGPSYHTTECSLQQMKHFVEEGEVAEPVSSDGLPLMEWNSCRARSCCNIQYKLSYDLLAEILCQLPVKSLGRLKCVCKSWDDVITNVCIPKIAVSTFCGFVYVAVRGFNIVKPKLFVGYASYAIPSAPTVMLSFWESFCPFLPFDAYPDNLLDCCNGLFLFKSLSLRYFVCNPMTKKSVEVPKGPTQKRSAYAALAFDPCRSLHYKVVCFNCTVPSPLILEIFSSETGKWTAQELPMEQSIQGYEWIRRCVYLNGVLYRLSLSKHLLCFDINDVVNVRAIALPGKATADNLGNIGASGGRLHYGIHDGSRLFVWLLEDHREVVSWSLVHDVCISDLAKQALSNELSNYVLSSNFRVYGMHPVSRVIFIGTYGAIIRFDFDDERLEIVHRLNNYSWPVIKDVYSVFPYSCCMVNLEDF